MSYKVLVVDHDTSSLLVLRSSLEKWGNYLVTTANHAQEAISMLTNNPYDLVLADVNMPDMNVWQLLEHIIREFNLPVILMSAVERADIMCMALENGAQHFLVKPIMVEHLKSIWQFCELWKCRKRNNIIAPLRQITGSSQAMVHSGNHRDDDEDDDDHNNNYYYSNNNNDGGMSISETENNADELRRGRIVWKRELHNRFLEAILVIGYQRAVPTNIVEVMNVEGLTTNHVMSHLQKFKKFLQSVMNGDGDIESSKWADLNYYSSIVSGNPTRMLINQLAEEQRKGKLDPHNPLRPPKPQNSTKSHVRAPNGSYSPCPPKLPPFTIPDSTAGASATTMNSDGANMGGTHVSIPNVNHITNQMGDYGQNTVAETQNYSSMAGAVGGNTFYFYNASYKNNQMGHYCQNVLAQNQNYSDMGGGLWKPDNANWGNTTGTSDMGGGLWKPDNANWGSTTGTNTPVVHNLSYGTNQMGYDSQNTVAQGGNYSVTGGVVGGVNNNMFTSTNIAEPSSIFCDPQQPTNVGTHANNDFLGENNWDFHKEPHVDIVEGIQILAEDDIQVADEVSYAYMDPLP